MAFNITKRVVNYLQPLMFLAISPLAFLTVLFEMLVRFDRTSDILSYSKLSGRVFGKTWLKIDSTIAKMELETEVPALVSQAYGIVLELGPGSGNQLPRYDLNKVSKIYGIEPNSEFHDTLMSTIKKAKLDDIYTIVPVGAEDTEQFCKYGLSPKSVDTILSVQVLCSVPDPQSTVRHLYSYLKPGGQMLVYEHVKSKDSVSAFVQWLYNLVWPFPMGGCNLDRPTEQYLRDAGDWSKINLKSPKNEDPWAVVPRTTGLLIK